MDSPSRDYPPRGGVAGSVRPDAPTERTVERVSERNGDGSLGRRDWEGRTRVVLSPIAGPSILGLFALMGGLLVLFANTANWYGTGHSPELFWPFVLIFGGLAQVLAGMWAYKARDGLATLLHGLWGSFFLGYGILYALIGAGTITAPTGTKFPELGFWFIVLAAVTAVTAVASAAESVSHSVTLLTLTGGSILLAIGLMAGISGVVTAGAWVMVFAAGFAFYVASALLLEESFARVVLPLGRPHRDNVPGHVVMRPIQYEDEYPGVRVGQ